MAADYTTVTEVPGGKATAEQLSMLYTRYSVAGNTCEGKDVLEVGCGSGHGLGFLARRARRVVGGDYTESLLRGAQGYYRGRIPLVRLDAHALPFPDHSFDVVVLFEAIYYLARPEEFLEDCRRVLRPEGTVLICSANKERLGFNASPFSTNYLSAGELNQLLTDAGFDAEIFGAFPFSAPTANQKLRERIRRLAAQLHLIPKTMKGKEFFKKIFYGRLAVLGPEIEENMAAMAPLHPISEDGVKPQFKVIYAMGRRPADGPRVRFAEGASSKDLPAKAVR